MLLNTCFVLLLNSLVAAPATADHIRNLQEQAIERNSAEFGHWGWEKDNYRLWSSHSNRLIPVYAFGVKGTEPGTRLSDYMGENSPYRSEEAIRKLYGDLPLGTLNEEASYLDQTNVFDLQRAALRAGKKHIILVVFDGMDWHMTRAAAISKTQSLGYENGRGTGLFMQDYQADGTTDFGWMVTAPSVDRVKFDVNTQSVSPSEGSLRGGYAYRVAGSEPWSICEDLPYLVGKSAVAADRHAYTDSSSSATSMTAGIKTFNGSVNVDEQGNQVQTIAHLAQEAGYRVGVVTSVPISHATPGAAYSHNVSRDDYQDLTRDLLGLPSVSHPENPLPGVDVLIGAGWGAERAQDAGQGDNFIPGNAYLTLEDLQKIDVRNNGKYVVAQRERGVMGAGHLIEKCQEAIDGKHRLFGYFGVSTGHMPFQTADGKYDPAPGRRALAEQYTEEDLKENPVLAEMARVALDYLNQDDRPFWLMVEAGDVDWAMHDNNIDNAIGAVLNGDDAVRAVAEWVEEFSSWDETVMIVTADHGHYLVLEQPELLISTPLAAEAAE